MPISVNPTISIIYILHFKSIIFILLSVVAFTPRDLLVNMCRATSLCVNVYKKLNHIWTSAVLRLQPIIPADIFLLLIVLAHFLSFVRLLSETVFKSFWFGGKDLCCMKYVEHSNLWISIMGAMLLQIIWSNTFPTYENALIMLSLQST